jgi:imidazolonepropionase-like amidohydrolase/Tol biopolymer transport system component
MKHPRLLALFTFLVVIALIVARPLGAQQPSPAPAKPAQEGEKAEDKKKDEKKWDVSADHGPTSEFELDTDEGTWMSVDVSPDGKEIAFDLLGDIYVMPITGGEAKALAGGMAWDMQPRYSPDGRWIAFTSDRAGGDNIWVMKRDGSDPRQVTKESFRLLNSPTWTPDSEFIGARKHFTSTRSLGAGEIWLYHRTGGDGLMMTKRPNEQKDLGEPAFSPDGKYLYYSQDTTPGPTFEYNKNPHAQIYTIQRLNREDGDVERFVTGSGGAIRPTPSPDGKWLAFIRRQGLKSVLFVMDVESGIKRPIYDGLDRDMQETWAIHGVYPTIAWTPDNKSIVFWAAGKIHRVDVESKQVSNIPFRVKTKLRVTEAVRFPVNVAPAKFPLKMLRWVTVSPQGDKVVYQALGHLYVRALPNGTPKRLTTQNEHFEYSPSFSRDGKWVAYTTWDDAHLGTVRVVSADGGEGRVLTGKPGHYADPTFSPDATTIVYRRMGSSFLRSPNWGNDTGLYAVPPAGGEARLVTKRGFAPHFGATSERVFFTTIEAENKRALRSIELDGSDERQHLLSEDATEFQVSPDEKWVAFTEQFNAYIAPFTRIGAKVDIGPKAKSIPIAKVSKDAGEYLHWSGDSKKLFWALGPELFTRELKEAFAFVEGAPEKLPDIPEKGVNIGFETDADVPSGAIAITGARIITMKGDEVVENGTIVVENNRIKAVGKNVAIPADAKRIDAKGHTVMPGFVDVHWHGSQGADEIVPRQNWVNFASLAFGVTTIHDPSNDSSTIYAAGEMQRAGLVTGPRIFSTGTILYGAKSPFKANIESLDDARSHLRRMKAIGAFSVKSYNQPRRDQRQQVIQAARELEMMVVPEGGSLYHHNMSMLVDGHTGIEHTVPVAKLYKDAITLWSNTKTGYTPTLVVAYGGLSGEYYWYQHTNVYENKRLLTFVPAAIIEARARRRDMAAEDDYNHFHIARHAKKLSDAGVSVQIGAHGQREGLGAHWEIWMLAQGGMTPLQALRSATLSGAKYLGMDKDIGSLEVGKLADLIVLEKNPLADIRNTESVKYVMVNGRIYDAATMDEVGNRPRKRAKFYWEE